MGTAFHKQPKPDPTALTVRQREVLTLLGKGKSNKQIASDLGLSVKTVEKHRFDAYEIIGVHDSVLATHYVLAQGWIANHFGKVNQ